MSSTLTAVATIATAILGFVMLMSNTWQSVLKSIQMTRAQIAKQQPSNARKNPRLGFWLKICILLISLACLLAPTMMPAIPLTRPDAAWLLLAQLNVLIAIMNLRN